MTRSKLMAATGISAILAGILFMVIQPLHPPDRLESVTTDAWVAIHLVSLSMVTLFVIGITGIYASQVERIGWLGLLGYLVLLVGLVATGIGDVIESLVQPQVAETDPAFVQGMLNMVLGLPPATNLGLIPAVWSLASAGFLGGTILFGVANFRAGVLSRPAALIFGFGLFLTAPVVGALGAPRIAAFPIAIGLAWLGYSVLTTQRAAQPGRAPEGVLEPSTSGAS